MKKIYVYISHYGGHFYSSNKLSWDEIYCEACNDCDGLVGTFKSLEDALKVYPNLESDD